MTREDIIRMSGEVGFSDEEIDRCQLMLEHFAKLVAEHEREEVAIEFDKMPFGDTSQSFAAFVRNMKQSAEKN